MARKSTKQVERDRAPSLVCRGELADADLVHDIATGDRDALAEVYERDGASVHGLARYVCGPRHADDVLQEVFLRLWREPQAFDAHRGSLRSFLLVMTRLRSIDILRSNKARRGRDARFVSDIEPEPLGLDVGLIGQGQRARIAE
jgi:RNA polymerase sigma-70 factor (ECF subfamily)